MTSRRSWLLTWALLGAALLAVHEGRYLLGYGGHAQEALARQGHAYLSFAAPLVAISVAAVLAWALVRATGGSAVSPTGARPPSTIRVAVACGVAVLALYAGQETLEGTLSSGHPRGLAGLLGAGGWTAVPLSALAGAVLALALRIVGEEPTLGVAFEVGLPRRTPLPAWAPSPEPPVQRRAPLARSGAERAPPATV